MIYLIGKGYKCMDNNLAIGVYKVESDISTDSQEEKYFTYAITHLVNINYKDDKVYFEAGYGFEIDWIASKKVFNKLRKELGV